ncbi:inner centromere protein B [Anopheles maculipalpis]|uniref:inner centromere protein B n=1 Tax=Anopheles maculipalpis TaxID=1496333 RepID=UPI00215950D9|nr:inner centromere protein B [Anopheles maculipalpis]
MDELLEMFNTFIGEAFDREKAMDVEFTEFEKKLNECVTLANERGTPIQNKKRPKRQVSISEKDEQDADRSSKSKTALNSGTAEVQVSSDRVAASHVRSSARMLNVTDNKGAGDEQEPQPMEMGNELVETSTAIRPSRTARLKAQEKLKEPTLKVKLRNDGGTTVDIKIERSSVVTDRSMVKERATPEQTYADMETENDANQANRIIPPVAGSKRNDEGFSSASEALKHPQEEEEKKSSTSRELSLMVIAPTIPKVEIVSDEEMPPPMMPPPKVPAPKVRTKKKVPASTGGKNGKEKEASNDTASSSAVSSADSTMNSTNSSVGSSNTSTASGRPIRTKLKMPAKQTDQVTALPTGSKELSVMIEPIRIKTEKLSLVQQSARTSERSTYEDAQEQQTQSHLERSQLEKQMRPLKIALERMPLQTAANARANDQFDLNGTYTTQPLPSSDGTFVLPSSVQDGTFTISSPMDNERDIAKDGTEPNRSGPPVQRANETFVIDKDQRSNGEQEGAMAANASIMTEDDSVVENSPAQMSKLPEQTKVKPPSFEQKVAPPATGPKPKHLSSTLKKCASSGVAVNGSTKTMSEAKKNKELFNPCVMSPIKSRIEAFEKCATTSSKIGTPQAQIGRLLKTVSTPTMHGIETQGMVRSAHAKPLASNVYTPNAATIPVPKASSASKAAQMQSRAVHHHTTASGGTGQMTRSQSRDSSWDRANGGGGGSGTLSAASSTSSLLDEKKKKREEKQRLAAAQREAMEREKREHAERLVREKEEKYRKLVHEKQEKMRIDAQKKARKLEEFEKRRQLEEQRTLADQKRDELAKQMAEQQRIDRELLETLKHSQAKENHEVKLHKQLYQQKLRQQQQQQQQQAAKKKLATAAKSQLFTFEMIDTDDSTDEEGEEDPNAKPRNKKRPPVPEWCKKTPEYWKQLAMQGQIDSKIIDRLFSVQPMTPDLRVLFPSIDAQKLKRNSSAIWRTPPRYSQLP